MRIGAFIRLVVACVCTTFGSIPVHSQNTAFTYQGHLTEAGHAAHGTYDLRFSLFPQPTGGSAIAGPLDISGIVISNALFTVSLDFGSAPFDGADRWLEIAVRTNGTSDPFTPLNPRQALAITPYALLARNVPNGAITTAKLAPGAVTSANIASNTITAAQIAPGAITATNLAAGSVGVAQLAKPYQSGAISLETMTPPASFGSMIVNSTVTFPTPFQSLPIITTTLDTPLSSAAAMVPPILVRQKRLNGFDLSFRVGNVPVPVATRGNIDIAPMLMVNGRPAMAFRNNSSALAYVRSSDTTGRRWPAGTVIGDSPRSGFAIAMAGGYPAIAFCDGSLNLKFVRATETNGAAWDAPITVRAAASGMFRASEISLAIIGGHPAIAGWDLDGRDIFYIRATDPLGSTWPVSPTLVATGLAGVALAEIDGRPAITYPADNGLSQSSVSYQAFLRYLRANDATGTSWPASPVNVTTAGPLNSFSETDMLPVGGNPGIFYRHSASGSIEVRFARASNSTGSSWGAPVEVFGPEVTSTAHDAALVNNLPAIAWYDAGNSTIRYSLSGNNGASFSTTAVFSNTEGNGGSMIPSLLDVGGRPAISFTADAAQELRYIRDTNPAVDTFINWIAIQP